MAGDFLIVNGVRLDVRVSSVTRDLEPVAGVAQAGAGELLDQRRQGRRRWRLTTTCKSRREARAIQALIEGYSHAIPFDGGMEATTSLLPTEVSGFGNITLRPDGGRGGGCCFVVAGESVGYGEAVKGGEDWTALGWIYVVDDQLTHHVARRSDGALFVDGERVIAGAFPIGYNNGPDEVTFGGFDVFGNDQNVVWSDCVIFKGSMPDAWIAQIAAWDAYFGPSPSIHVEGSLIDSPLGIFATGTVLGGSFTQHGGYTQRGGHPEDKGWANNELEIDFTIVEDDRAPSLDFIPIADLYAPMTARAKIDTSAVVAAVNNNAMNGNRSGSAPVLTLSPAGVDAERWARWTADGIAGTVSFSGTVDPIVDANTSRFSVSFWLYVEADAVSGGSITSVLGCTKNAPGARSWLVELNASGGLKATVWDESAGAFVGVETNDPIPLDEWIHVVVVHDSVVTGGVSLPSVYGRTVALFINGDEPEANSFSSGVFVAADYSTSLGIPDTSPASDAKYGLAHVAGFSRRALTRAQIRTLYRLGRRGAWLRRV